MNVRREKLCIDSGISGWANCLYASDALISQAVFILLSACEAVHSPLFASYRFARPNDFAICSALRRESQC